MKTPLLLGGLLGLAACESEQVVSHDSEVSMQVSARENTWLEVETHWTGAFAGSAHNEYTLYFVRRHSWWLEDERWVITYWPATPTKWGPGPVLRRIDADTIAVEVPWQNGVFQTTKYALKGYRPQGKPRP